MRYDTRVDLSFARFSIVLSLVKPRNHFELRGSIQKLRDIKRNFRKRILRAITANFVPSFEDKEYAARQRDESDGSSIFNGNGHSSRIVSYDD